MLDKIWKIVKIWIAVAFGFLLFSFAVRVFVGAFREAPPVARRGQQSQPVSFVPEPRPNFAGAWQKMGEGIHRFQQNLQNEIENLPKPPDGPHGLPPVYVPPYEAHPTWCECWECR